MEHKRLFAELMDVQVEQRVYLATSVHMRKKKKEQTILSFSSTRHATLCLSRLGETTKVGGVGRAGWNPDVGSTGRNQSLAAGTTCPPGTHTSHSFTPPDAAVEPCRSESPGE